MKQVVSSSRTSGQRGAIAPMAVVIFPVLLLLAFAMLATAEWEVHREALRHGTDAVALGNALFLEMSPVQNWSPTPLDTTTIMGYNMLESDNTVSGGASDANNLALAEANLAGGYSTPTVTIPTSGGARHNLPYFSSPAVSGNTKAYFNQISAVTLFPVKPRYMLMLDFSRSMRLDITTGGEKAHNVIQNAVADLEKMPLSQRINWGMRIFAGASTPAQATGLTDNAIATNSLGIDPANDGVQDPMVQLGIMNGIASTEPTLGDSTDIATPIDDVLTPLGHVTNPNVGRAYILLVTDGEPDLVQGQDMNSMTYAQRVQAADAAALAAMQQAWTEGVTSLTVYVNRENTAYDDADDRAFLLSIAGSSADPANPNDFAEADSEGDLAANILKATPQLHCRTSSDLTQMGVPDIHMPAPNDVIFGQMAGVNGTPDIEVPMVYCGQGDTLGILNGNDPTGINGCMDTGDPNFDTFGTGQITNIAGARYAFYYDAPRKVFELNDWACAVYLDPVANLSKQVRFRARWGMPWLQCGASLNGCDPQPLL